MKKFLFILFGLFVVMGAFAAGENIPTSKGYVDAAVAQKQDKISANIITGYTRLEYLESTGRQWIDTGVVADNTTEAEVDFMDFVGSTYLFFTTNGGWNSRNFGIIINDYLRFYMNCDGRTTYTRPSGTNVSGNIKLLTTGIFLNDTQLSIGMGRIPSSTAFTTTYPIVLFGGNSAGTPSASAKVKIRYFKLWKNHETVRDFIPARRNSDGVLGMYDKVTNTFFTNSGTGEFIAGPVIIPGNQVLTNTGTAGEYGTKEIYDANGAYAVQAQNLVDAVTMNTAVQNAIDSEFQCVEYNPNDPTDCWLLDIVHAQDAMALPIGYTALEYIEGTGSQYINTGVQTSSTQRIEYDVRLDHVVMSNGQTQILGAGGANEGTLYSFRFEPGANIKIYYKPDGGIDTNIPQDTNRHRLILDLKNKFASVDGRIFNFSSLPSGQTYSQYLFAYSMLGDANTQYGFKGKMYGAKIYDNGVLVRNFIPARHNSDNKIGMYDTVTNTFFTNSGTGNFIAGPVANMYLPAGN